MYRLITDDYNQIVGTATIDENGKVTEVKMYGEIYTNPKEWEEKFGLPNYVKLTNREEKL